MVARDRKEKLFYQEKNNQFVITYGNRKIIVIVTRKLKTCSYKVIKKNVEQITIAADGELTIEQTEYFIKRYKTSKLVKILFNFSAMREPVLLIQWDPANSNKFSEIQFKLKSFIRNN